MANTWQHIVADLCPRITAKYLIVLLGKKEKKKKTDHCRQSHECSIYLSSRFHMSQI